MGLFSAAVNKVLDERERKAAISRAKAVIESQTKPAEEAGVDVFLANQTYFGLGYLFGVFQASLETLPSSAGKQITQQQYHRHVQEGFSGIFPSKSIAQKQFQLALQYWTHDACEAGRRCAAQDWVDMSNQQGYRPKRYAEYLVS